MGIDSIQIVSNSQPIPVVNLNAGGESKILSKETGLPAVTRQDKSAKAGDGAAKEQELSGQDAKKLADRINRIMGLIDKRLKFTVHEKSGEIQVKIIDQKTGDVLDEIPSKRLLDLMASFRDLTGMFIDKRA